MQDVGPSRGGMDWLRLARTYWAHDRIERSLAVLRVAQQSQPNDLALAELRTDILRSQGQRAGWERHGYDAHPPVDREIHAAPYAVIHGFLDARTRGTLRELVVAHRDDFGPATVGAGRLDEETRRSLRLRDPAAERVARQTVLHRLEPVLRELFGLLTPGDGSFGRIECKVTACPGGGYFKPHRDDVAHEEPGTSNHDRVLSYVCWFHREPVRFTGGELVLHDAWGRGYHGVAGTRFIPTSGTMVVFPSASFHSVRPVVSDATDVVDSRLALTGHVRHS